MRLRVNAAESAKEELKTVEDEIELYERWNQRDER